MPPDSTLIASWPRHLQELWRDCVERGEVDARNPPATIVEAYLQVAEARVRRLAGIPWGDRTHDFADDEEEYPAELARRLATCARCGAADLEHFYTSKRSSLTLGPACLQRRVTCGIAREADTHHP